MHLRPLTPRLGLGRTRAWPDVGSLDSDVVPRVIGLVTLVGGSKISTPAPYFFLAHVVACLIPLLAGRVGKKTGQGPVCVFTLTVLTVSGSREHVTGWAVRWTGGPLVDMADFPPLLAAGARIACYYVPT